MSVNHAAAPASAVLAPGSRAALDPVSAVAQWRAAQIGRLALSTIPLARSRSEQVQRVDTLTHEAYAAAQACHVDLAAALVHERRTAVAAARAMGQVHDVADEPMELDDALATYLAARLDTTRILREVLIRDYGCDGCLAEAGEGCFANCLPSPRNAPDEPAPADRPATVHLVRRTDLATGEQWDAFADGPDACAFVDAAGITTPVVTTRVVSREAALSRIAATRPRPPQD